MSGRGLKQLVYGLTAATDRDHAIKRLRRLEYQLPSREARFAVPWTYRGRGLFRAINAHQTPQEIEALYREVCKLEPRTVLEIGTARGGTLYLWAQAATDDALLVSVDLPGGFGGGGYPDARGALYEAFARPGQSVKLLRADSHAPQTLGDVKRILGGRAVDYLFIDGDHTYAGVKADLVQYGPLVRAGGMIGFHDIMPRPDVAEIEVDRLWRQVRARYPDVTTEFVTPNRDGRRIGLGLLRVPEGGISVEGWE